MMSNGIRLFLHFVLFNDYTKKYIMKHYDLFNKIKYANWLFELLSIYTESQLFDSNTYGILLRIAQIYHIFSQFHAHFSTVKHEKTLNTNNCKVR